MFFPDPVLDTFSKEGPDKGEKGTGILCSHCHKEIKGTARQYNNQYFDSYCWNLRFILNMGDEEDQKKEDLKRFLQTQMRSRNG